MRCVRGRTGAGTVEEREAGSHWAGRDGMHRFSALICQEGGAVACQRCMVLEKSPTPLRWREETKAPGYFATLDCGAPERSGLTAQDWR